MSTTPTWSSTYPETGDLRAGEEPLATVEPFDAHAFGHFADGSLLDDHRTVDAVDGTGRSAAAAGAAAAESRRRRQRQRPLRRRRRRVPSSAGAQLLDLSGLKKK